MRQLGATGLPRKQATPVADHHHIVANAPSYVMAVTKVIKWIRVNMYINIIYIYNSVYIIRVWRGVAYGWMGVG